MRKDHRADQVGPWAEEKLAALEDYLRYYCKVLKKKPFKLVYIDGFAGSPVTTVRQEKTSLLPDTLLEPSDLSAQAQFVLGSPLRALQIEKGFHRHYFFDLDDRRVKKLEELQIQFPTKTMHISVGDANDRILKLLDKVRPDPMARGVAFLDPYGPNLNWSTVEALAATKRFEVIINLPIHMAINRMLNRDGERKPEWESRVDKCFGTEEWRDFAYPESIDMFGLTSKGKASDVPKRLLRLYHGRLAQAFPHVTKPRLIRNTAGGPLYYLLWAGPNPAGKKGADYVFENRKLISRRRLL